MISSAVRGGGAPSGGFFKQEINLQRVGSNVKVFSQGNLMGSSKKRE